MANTYAPKSKPLRTHAPRRDVALIDLQSNLTPRVVISNGAKNFHLSSAASEIDARGGLLALFNGIYPNRTTKLIVRFLGVQKWKRIQRMLGRAVEIDENKVRVFLLADLANDVAVSLRRYPRLAAMTLSLNRWAMEIFANRARILMAREFSSADIYHYRAGFGLASVDDAKRRGNFALCDHSIVHPLVLDAMVQDGGRLPDSVSKMAVSGIWDLVLRDIDAADHVLVNSDFVKQTFTHVGVDPQNVSVIYLGVDDAFLEVVPQRLSRTGAEPLRLLFAGSFSKRKGADTLIDAIAGLPDKGWTLEIAGPVEPDLRPSLDRLLDHPRIQYLGNLARSDLAAAMSRADVFVFPSLAEGSARVVFEALACGCFVATTPNAGSIVQDGVHGRITQPGDVRALRNVLSTAIKDAATVAEIGLRNAALIRSSFTQRAYGDALQALYIRLVGQKHTTSNASRTESQ